MVETVPNFYLFALFVFLPVIAMTTASVIIAVKERYDNRH
jgi:hypothetical protein